MCIPVEGGIYVCISALQWAAQFCVFEYGHVKVIRRRGGRLSAARMTSFPQVSWVLSLLKASCLNHLILPANLQRGLHPQMSADSSIRALPIALPDRPPPLLSQSTEKKKPTLPPSTATTTSISPCPLSFFFPLLFFLLFLPLPRALNSVY